ncbi:SDR family oxidoreductase [Massilia sp. Bi118]|uniref:SDR family oxidoreductase n=1 Tax=Massilia sp. Bi118 TaxID=2822346 RepID=UPI001E61A01D|nr:SDR family oxidoreductase [Massilia sp. Bi118]
MNKTILITGASRGIGAACALLAAARGYQVCINYRSDTAAALQLVRAIEDAGGSAFAVQADVSREDEVMRMFAGLDARYGRLDALVNNAGILARQMRVEQMDASRIERIFATNVTGSFLCAREAVLRMSAKRGGRGGAIVNVSSRAAVLGSSGEYVDYAASKAALDVLTIGLAKEVAEEGIRVNGVRPGLIATEMHASGGEPGRVERLKNSVPMGRGGEAEEVARAVLWLLSDEASYTTGSFIDVSGGR